MPLICFGKDLYDECEFETRSLLLDAQEPLAGEDAFWKGINLLKEGRFVSVMVEMSPVTQRQ